MKKYFITFAILAISSALRADVQASENTQAQPQPVATTTESVAEDTQPTPSLAESVNAQSQPASTQEQTTSSEEQTSATPQQEQAQTTASAEENLTPEEQQIKSLLRKNPFAEPGSVVANGLFGNTQSPAAAPDGLELRSITCIDGKWKFYIYDASMKMGYRIGLKQPQNDMSPYTVDFYDEETNSISISNSLGTYTLTLKVPDAPTGKVVGASTPTAKKKVTAKTTSKTKAHKR